jgi:hypothetical protein
MQRGGKTTPQSGSIPRPHPSITPHLVHARNENPPPPLTGLPDDARATITPKSLTWVEVERWLGGPVLRACGHIGVVKGSQGGAAYVVVESYVTIVGDSEGFPD